MLLMLPDDYYTEKHVHCCTNTSEVERSYLFITAVFCLAIPHSQWAPDTIDQCILQGAADTKQGRSQTFSIDEAK